WLMASSSLVCSWSTYGGAIGSWSIVRRRIEWPRCSRHSSRRSFPDPSRCGCSLRLIGAGLHQHLMKSPDRLRAERIEVSFERRPSKVLRVHLFGSAEAPVALGVRKVPL